MSEHVNTTASRPKTFLERLLAGESPQLLAAEARGKSVSDAMLDLVAAAVREPATINSAVHEQIFELLASGGSARFEGSWEVSNFLERLLEVIVIASDSSPSTAEGGFSARSVSRDDAVRLIAACLRKPLRRHVFALGLVYPVADLGFTFEDFQIGGPYNLQLRRGTVERVNLGAQATVPATILQGEVLAATYEGAINKAARVFDTFLGAMLAAGLCRFVNPWLTPNSTVATIQIDDGGWRTGGLESFAFDPQYTHRLNGTALVFPPDLTEPERRLLAQGDVPKALQRHFRYLDRVLVGETEAAKKIQNACRLAVHAVVTADFGVAITLAFAVIEGLLLEGKTTDETLGRLAEAVAHSLGSDAGERERLRETVKTLYDVRSVFVHTGEADERSRRRNEVLELMLKVVRKEGDGLPHP